MKKKFLLLLFAIALIIFIITTTVSFDSMDNTLIIILAFSVILFAVSIIVNRVKNNRQNKVLDRLNKRMSKNNMTEKVGDNSKMLYFNGEKEEMIITAINEKQYRGELLKGVFKSYFIDNNHDRIIVDEKHSQLIIIRILGLNIAHSIVDNFVVSAYFRVYNTIVVLDDVMKKY